REGLGAQLLGITQRGDRTDARFFARRQRGLGGSQVVRDHIEQILVRVDAGIALAVVDAGGRLELVYVIDPNATRRVDGLRLDARDVAVRVQDLRSDVDVGGVRRLRHHPDASPVTARLQRALQLDGHVHRLHAPDVHERAFADELLEDVFRDLAFGDAGIEHDDADVEQLLLGYHLGRLIEIDRVGDHD